MRLFYVPLERYQESYSEYLSGPDGMFERQAKNLGIDVVPIRPHGQVRTNEDLVAICNWGFEQTQQLVQMITSGFIGPTDVIYFERHFQPGMEMIPLARVCAKRPTIKLYSYLFDVPEELYEVENFDVNWEKTLDGVFTAGPGLDGPEVGMLKMHVGLVFDHTVLYDILKVEGAEFDPRDKERSNHVYFASKWNQANNPDFYCQLAETVLAERKDVYFHVCTGAPDLVSDDRELCALAKRLQQKYPLNFRLHLGLSKQEYFSELAGGAVMFSANRQNLLSYTLLEGAAFGCAPLFPYFPIYRDALHGRPEYIYKMHNVFDAKQKLYALLGGPVRDYGWVYAKYENSVHRMMQLMGFPFEGTNVAPSLDKEVSDGKFKAQKDVYS